MIESLWIFFDSLRTHICMIETLWIFFDNVLEHIYSMIESLWKFFWQPYNTYMHDWITKNNFLTALEHIYAWLNHYKFFDSLRTHICMIESVWFFLTALEHIYAWLNHYEIFLTALEHIYAWLNHYEFFIDSLRTHICMIESHIWNRIFVTALELHICMIESL